MRRVLLVLRERRGDFLCLGPLFRTSGMVLLEEIRPELCLNVGEGEGMPEVKIEEGGWFSRVAFGGGGSAEAGLWVEGGGAVC